MRNIDGGIGSRAVRGKHLALRTAHRRQTIPRTSSRYDRRGELHVSVHSVRSPAPR